MAQVCSFREATQSKGMTMWWLVIDGFVRHCTRAWRSRCGRLGPWVVLRLLPLLPLLLNAQTGCLAGCRRSGIRGMIVTRLRRCSGV
jgi:hypothetical protein